MKIIAQQIICIIGTMNTLALVTENEMSLNTCVENFASLKKSHFHLCFVIRLAQNLRDQARKKSQKKGAVNLQVG